MPGGVGGQRREPLPTRLEITFPHETTKGAEHRNIFFVTTNQDNTAISLFETYLLEIGN